MKPSKKKIATWLGVLTVIASMFTAPVAGVVQAVSTALATELSRQAAEEVE